MAGYTIRVKASVERDIAALPHDVIAKDGTAGAREAVRLRVHAFDGQPEPQRSIGWYVSRRLSLILLNERI
jgi:hypothetical protein